MPHHGERLMTRVSYPRLPAAARLDAGVGEWLAAINRGFDALDFLERSRDLAAETVVRSGWPMGPPGHDAIPSHREDSPGSGARPPVR
jgi:hypothetical protein